MTPGTTPPPTPRRIALTVVALLYIFGVAAYFAYGYVTDTGLSGWLVNWQLRHFSEAHSSFTQFALLVLWLLGLAPFLFALARLNKAENYVPAQTYAQHQAASYSPRNRKLGAVTVVGLTAATFAYLTVSQGHLASQTLHQINLNATAELPPDAELANVHGTMAANYGYSIEEIKYGRKEGSTYYVPLLPATWQPGEPVRVVVKTRIPVYQNTILNRVFFIDSAQAFSATYDGRLHADDVPTYVRQHLASQGLALANPCYTLDDEAVANGEPTQAGVTNRWLVLGIGLLVALTVLFRKQPQR